jgi:uncharacterized protein with PIN domain
VETAHILFDPRLAVFLVPEHRNHEFDFLFQGPRSVKDMIEALGVPHTEIGRILANGRRVDAAYHVQDGDRIEVLPWHGMEAANDAVNSGEVRFVADIHLGRLVAHLRMLGFDTVYPGDYRDEELARIADDEARILLTRDIGLLKRGRVLRGYFLRATAPLDQLAEVLAAFHLRPLLRMFSRCAVCNGELQWVDKQTIEAELPANTRETFDEFRRCIRCGKLYWKGSHYDRLNALLQSLESPSETL